MANNPLDEHEFNEKSFSLKWVQLSDIHFGSPDSHVIETMREHFLEKCSQLQGIDYLFLTGDLRYGKSHPEKYPDGTIEFLQDVQKNLRVSPDNTFMVPGNHDIYRVGGLDAAIDEIRKQYLPQRTISDKKYMPILNLSKEEYCNLYQKICGRDMKNDHFFIEKDKLNIIHINTSILCGKEREDGNLFIDMLALRHSLDDIDRTKPSIAIAHHPFDCLEYGEQEQLELLLKQFNTILFLCGHKHIFRCKNIHTVKTNINLWEYICGTNMDNPPNTEPTEIGFFTGYIDVETKTGCVEGHKWSRRLNAWMPNDEFSFPQNGDNDGKYYFPERITVSNDYYDDSLLDKVRNEYCKYLKSECGEIQLDGLPIDKETGNRKIALEKLFVPLQFRDNDFQPGDEQNNFRYRWGRTKITEFHNLIPAEGNFKLAVFSGPGGGKTTWMKRLASVYGFGNYGDIEDHLPERTLFPIWIKCRQFGTGTSLSILEIIHGIPKFAGFDSDECLKKEFFEMACRNIQRGTALILIDGLDEISGTEARLDFISKLNRFAEMYDKANIVMTSRSVGYDQVAKNLTVDFTHRYIKRLEEKDIMRLCTSWHKIFYGDSEKAITEAEELSNAIISDERIFKLVQTPVLLTTLLLVKRRVGQLPKKRAKLYSEAIEVLLYTWAADVQRTIHPIDLDEAHAQLAYLAYYMMFHGKPQQIIGKTDLKKVLFEARENLPQFFNTTSEEDIDLFIKHVEGRSELLVMRGHRQVNENSDNIEEVYEFSHLTIQEYLAAYAIREKYYPNVTQDNRISDCFEKVLEENDMREVILLTTVLTDRWGAEDIANKLLDKLLAVRNQRHIDRQEKINHIINLLMLMIADEAPLTPNMREKIYKDCFSGAVSRNAIDVVEAVYSSSKYNTELQNVLKSCKEYVFAPLFKLFELRQDSNFSIFAYYFENMRSEKIIEALDILNTAAWLGNNWLGKIPDNIQAVKENIANLCLNEDEQVAQSAFNALFFLCDSDELILSGKLLQVLLKWNNFMRFTYKFPITQDTVLHLQSISLTEDQKQNIEEHFNQENNTYDLLGYFWFGVLCGVWDIATVIQKAQELQSADYINKTMLERFCNRMIDYISILQNANVIPPENEDLVKEYLDKLVEQQKQAKKKNDLFDW